MCISSSELWFSPFFNGDLISFGVPILSGSEKTFFRFSFIKNQAEVASNIWSTRVDPFSFRDKWLPSGMPLPCVCIWRRKSCGGWGVAVHHGLGAVAGLPHPSPFCECNSGHHLWSNWDAVSVTSFPLNPPSWSSPRLLWDPKACFLGLDHRIYPFILCIGELGNSLVAQRIKHLPAMRETRVWSLGWEDPLEKEMATHSSILAWRIPWTEEPGRLQSTGSQRVRHNWATSLHFTSLCIGDITFTSSFSY